MAAQKPSQAIETMSYVADNASDLVHRAGRGVDIRATQLGLRRCLIEVQIVALPHAAHAPLARSTGPAASGLPTPVPTPRRAARSPARPPPVRFPAPCGSSTLACAG